MKTNKRKTNQLALKGGSYSLTVTAVVLAILVAVNIFVSAMPANLTKYDISASKLYSITSNTKAVVNNLQQDVTIYWVVQADAEDDIIENLLAKYDALSPHIDVVRKNPDVFPTFTESYTEETVPNNSLIVESGESYRYIRYDDLYELEPDPYSYSYTVSGFDGEGAITSAIDYVVTEDLPTVYLLEGHGEKALPATFADSIEKENIETLPLSLLNVDAVPEDADAVMIHGPQSDITAEEAAMLAAYTEQGGKLLVMSGPVEGQTLTNLNSLLLDQGVTVNTGIVVEAERQFYAFSYPYILMPQMQASPVTDALITGNYYPILPLAAGLTVDSTAGNVTPLLTTSDTAYNKTAGFALESWEKEETDTEGPFTLAVSVSTGSDGEIIWFSSSEFLEDMYNAYSSGANNDLAMNAVSSLLGQREAIAIRSKSLNYNYLTINEETASVLKLLMIGVFPLAYLGIGVGVIVYKRRKQNEAV